MKNKRNNGADAKVPAGRGDWRYRAVSMAGNAAPATWDAESRSVMVTAATETPVEMYDYELGRRVPEVLLMSGAMLPRGNRCPLLESHSRWSTADVVGSARELAVAERELVCRVVFSSVSPADKIAKKVEEGHITDFSIGYSLVRGGSVYVPEGERATIEGREFAGPVVVRTRWKVRELSVCPIGADEDAKVRGEETNEGESEMDEKLRAQLVALGMDAKATDEEAVRFLEELVQQRAAAGNEEPKKTQKPDGAAAGNGNRADTGKPAGAGQVADAEALRQAGAVAERERVSGIRKLCERFATPELERTLVDEGRTVEDAQRLVYETALLRQATTGGSVRVTQDEHDKVRSAGRDALLLRAGRKVEKPADGADDLAGRSLPELARMCLERAGVPTRGMSRAQIVEAALRGRAGEMSTGDFTEIIAAGLRTSLREGWDLAEETWEEWTDGSGRVDDLETHKAIDTSEFDDLDEVGELEEYKYGYITEGAEEFAVYKYGKLAGASMELILADQIDAILGLPARMGESCRRKGGDVVYTVLTANANMGDSVALFHNSSHGNLATGGDLGAPSVATLDAAELAMVKQTGRRGLANLQIRPKWLLAPWALKGAAEVFFGSKFQDTGSYATANVNPWFGDKLKRIYEIRLDDDSVTAWYLAAARNTVRTYRLRGYESPQMSEHPEWKNDSITWKIRWFFGATALDYRGLYKNPNT